MKKAFLIFCALVFALCIRQECFGGITDALPIYKNLKVEVLSQLNELFDREVSVESVSGILINQIELNNVSIAKGRKLSEGSIIKAKKIILNYNPFKLAASSGNITAAISKIIIIEPEILVERSIRDEWNMASLIPKVKTVEEKEVTKPLFLNATVLIRGGYGSYVDHMGFGEDLKGKAFVSKIKDLNGEVKIFGNRINLSGTATSVIGRAIAYTSATGNLNVKTGKYRFSVIAKNVDIEKWGYYTLNIPHFKPISGLSDMNLTMTNPPPRKKALPAGRQGLPIFFDGKFYLKNCRARVFDREIDAINGYVNVHDEDARFRNLTGLRSGLPLTVNGRLYDFSVANYDINIQLPRSGSKKIISAFPELAGMDFSGYASSNIQVGGNYGHPVFNGSAEVSGLFLKQKLSGKFNFMYEGSVLDISSDNISAYGGLLSNKSTLDFTTPVPNIDIIVSGEGVSLKEAFNIPLQEQLSVNASIKGSTERFEINGTATTTGSGEIKAFGIYESGNIDLKLHAKELKIAQTYLNGKLNAFDGSLKGDLVHDPATDLELEGKLSLGNAMFASQKIAGGSATFKYKGQKLDLSSLVLQLGRSYLRISGQTGIGCQTMLSLEAVSAEASDLIFIETFMPKELIPVSGMLDLSLLLKGEITKESDIEPSKFSVGGQILLRDGYLSYEKVKVVNINILWKGGRLTFRDSIIKTDSSDVLINGSMEAYSSPRSGSGSSGHAGNINLDISGNLDLANLRPFTIKYGRLFGISKLKCHIDGSMDKPLFDITFDVSGLRYNEITINRLAGRVIGDGENVYFAKPLEIDQGNDEYVVSGKLSLTKQPSIALRLDVLKGDLNTAVPFLDDINAEIGSRQILGQPYEQKFISLYPAKFKVPDKRYKLLYKSGGNKTQIDEIKKAENESSAFAKTIKEREKRKVNGKFTGFLEVNGIVSNPSGKMNFILTGGTWESYSFDEAMIKGRLENGTFEAESLYIKKGGGALSASGSFNPAASASLEIKAENMPIDFLSLFIGKGKSFEGNFNMAAYIRGPVSSPVGSADIRASAVKLAGIGFDNVGCVLKFSDNTLYFTKAELTAANRKAAISGKLPLAKDGISIALTMEGESLGLLTLVSKDISWISGGGQGFVRITGNVSHPLFNGDLAVNDAAIYLKVINSNLEAMNADLIITNNFVSTESLSARWVGAWTQGKTNKIRISGGLDLDDLFLKERTMAFSFKLKDTDLTVDLPNLYKGDLEIKDVYFNGPLSLIAESQTMPKLSGIFNASNGVIILPDMSKKTNLPPVKLDLKLDIGKNTYVAAGDIKNLISTDFSNLLLNLEIEGENITISGDLANPDILGKTIFKRGTINIINREFSLMSEDRQKQLFATDLEKVKENSAVFSGGSLPNLSLSAEIKVKSTEKITEAVNPGEPPKPVIYKTTNVLIVSRITGVPFSEEKEQGIKLSFDSFIEDTTKQPPEVMPGNFDEQEIKVLLLPDFIKGSLGISETGVGQVDANEVVVDYLNSRLNSYFLRNVERDLAKSLELESLTLEYNFGKDIKNMMAAKTETSYTPTEAPETMYGIGAVKGFFDRFYIDVRYSQAVQEQAVINKAFLNYQITYKLSPVLSVEYYREPFSFLEEASDYYKVTLKAGYQI